MAIAHHNPDSQIAGLTQMLAQGRKRVGFLIGAGAPASCKDESSGTPLIPQVAQLTTQVIEACSAASKEVIQIVSSELGSDPNIESILSRIRAWEAIIGSNKLGKIDKAALKKAVDEITTNIVRMVDIKDKVVPNSYLRLASWLTGAERSHPVEIFTTNYDLLIERALEKNGVPFFDGFVGSSLPFFDASTVSSNDLPNRWVRLWKIHGSLGWELTEEGAITKRYGGTTQALIYPEHLKYSKVQRQPYASLLERLSIFLKMPDTILLVTGFSFNDAHVTAVIDDALSVNPSAALFSFQFEPFSDDSALVELANRRANVSAYFPDKAVLNCIAAEWKVTEEVNDSTLRIRGSYWKDDRLLLGDYAQLARYLVSSTNFG